MEQEALTQLFRKAQARADFELGLAQEYLWEAQICEYPDSIYISPAQAVQWMGQNCNNHMAASLAMTLHYSVGVFYECGLNEDGTYKWKGFRFGLAPEHYLSF